MGYVMPAFVQDFGNLDTDEDSPDTLLTPQEFEQTCYYLIDDACYLLQQFLDGLYGANKRSVEYMVKMLVT